MDIKNCSLKHYCHIFGKEHSNISEQSFQNTSLTQKVWINGFKMKEHFSKLMPLHTHEGNYTQGVWKKMRISKHYWIMSGINTTLQPTQHNTTQKMI